jgi:hypothetical protein
MGSVQREIDRLERELLIRGVDLLAEQRNRCADCGRTPLIGERVHVHGGSRRLAEQLVCELCSLERSDPPLSSDTVRHCEHGHTVRLSARV